MTKPSYQDARLMLQLAQVYAALGLSEAWSWVRSDEFVADYSEFSEKYPPGSEEFRKINDICSWMETLGTLYKHGLFNEELLFDWISVGLVWDRLQGIALGERERFGLPSMFENFEAMANANKQR